LPQKIDLKKRKVEIRTNKHKSKKLLKMSAKVIVRLRTEDVLFGIRECDDEVRMYEARKLATIIGMTTTAKVDMTDWDISMYDLCLENSKLERQFWVAMGLLNWKLLKLIRAKVRGQCDKMMEHMDIGIEKEWMKEDEYIQSSNMLKKMLDEMDDIMNGLAEYVEL
jgi:hypothetical protein